MKKAIRVFGRVIVYAIIIICLAITVIPPFLDRIYYVGPVGPHFDGSHFSNPDGDDTFRLPAKGGRAGFMVSRVLGKTGAPPWPDTVAVTPAKPKLLPPLQPGEMRAIWIGHATVLIQTPEINIITDPIWANRAGPFGFGPARVTAPGVALDDLPKIDVVVVSHNHYDHMDLDTVGKLWARDKPLIVTSLGNDALIKRTGAKVIAADWGVRVPVRPGIEVVVTRNHHWSSRWFADRNRALWSSFLFRLPGGNVYFAGDTGFGDGAWPNEAASYGPVRLALIPIGAFRFQPGQMHIGSHIGPILAERVFASLNPVRAIPIHWGTFKLSDEARDTPPKMLSSVMKCAGYADPAAFSAVTVGTPVMVPALPKGGVRPAPPPPDPKCLADPAITGLP
jgi:L-ascorbate metabolism protein UlaG (beta-lactamase superfamily)